MRFSKSLLALVTIFAVGLVLAPKGGATDVDQQITLTFNQPVGIPGTILDPGTYVFKVMEVVGSYNVVQVLNKRMDHVYGTFLANTKIKNPTGDVLVRFRETRAGAPLQIDAWWYPGFDDGHQFIYSNGGNQAANQTNQPAPEMSAANR